ncbi:MAG: hypothetical protein ACT4P7_17785 [Gemmatimonadaceae bacterium]
MTSRPMVARLAWLAVLAAVSPTFLAAQLVDDDRVVWRTLIGETAFEVRAISGSVYLGAASDEATVSVTFRATDARRFADSLTRRLSPRRSRETTWTLRLEEPGVSAGALSISPAERQPDKTRQYLLFVADDVVTAVRQTLNARETAMLARKLREAAAAALPRPPTRRRPNVTRPAVG